MYIFFQFLPERSGVFIHKNISQMNTIMVSSLIRNTISIQLVVIQPEKPNSVVLKSDALYTELQLGKTMVTCNKYI